MIKIIYGPKGTGKTKIMIDEANAAVASAKGHMIFVTNTKRYMYDLHRDPEDGGSLRKEGDGHGRICRFAGGLLPDAGAADHA